LKTLLRAFTTFAGLLLASGQVATAAPGQSFEAASNHWAYKPIQTPVPPRVHSSKRVQTPIDTFLLAKLEQKKLGFSPPADKRTLLRRAYYDLIGLPPTMEETEAFLRDGSSMAFGKVVDRLLASPRYGERWGRHWLDVARYSDTKDLVLVYGKDALRPYAYTYRDYVIRAFNEDLPFDQFVRDQLAADLEEPKLPSWRLAALGFLTLGRLFDNNPHDQIDDQIDTTTRGFLALTVACARCHDHKYDAIRQREYYALYGVFASTEQPYDLPLIEDPKQVPGGVEFEKQLAKARQELEHHIDTEFTNLTEMLRQRVGDYLVRAATTPPDLTETAQFGLSLTPDDFRPTLMQRTRRLLERRANAEDHVFGPWAQLMALPDDAFAAQTNLDKTAESAVPQQLSQLTNYNVLVVAALRDSALTNKAVVAHTYGQLLHTTYQEYKASTAHATNSMPTPDQRELLDLVIGKESPVWFPRRDTPDHMSRAEKDRYGSLVGNLDKVAANATNQPPARAMVVADLPEPVEPHIFKRGNPSRPGEKVPRAFLRVLSREEPLPFEHGSGRLDLARAIASPGNPLTARVLVNRVWMHHFGEPLVATTTDFGTRSEPPLNPELLDWLAADFVRSGWSLKHLHRVMMLSSAYQQSSAPPETRRLVNKSTAAVVQKVSLSPSIRPAMDPSGDSLDAENKLLSHYPRRRLDFEAMRDSMLYISGNLDNTIGGRPVDLVAEPLCRRRTVYGLVDRQNLPAVYRAFDFASPDQCAERRPRTMVPQQALFALNSPFVMEQAQAVASLPEITGATNSEGHLQALFRRILGRAPTKAEIESALRFIRAAEAEAPGEKGLKPWEQLAQIMLISNEAVYVE
jgi:hypothetical protein